MLDGVTVADEGVEAGVAADRIFRARDVVANGGGEKDHGDTEGRVIFLGFADFAERGEGFKAADDEDGVEFPDFEALGCFGDANFRGGVAIRANFRSAFADPAFNPKPIERADRA